MRENKRYLAFKIDSKTNLDNYNAIKTTIKDALKDYFGELGLANAGLMFINYDAETNTGIVKVNHKYQDHLKASFALIKKINKEDVIVRSIKSSGILKKLKR